ncbi:FAD-dependent oxidoreductase [Flavobacterium sp.]|uniref:FAD-dependent oxidoreductase n=1 Tax=Flavobacterium sp. TaxID=239 RepID=UPI0039E45676
MKNGENYNSRRTFFKGIAAAILLAPLVQACKEKVVTLLIKLTGTNHLLGHRLRSPDFPKPVSQIRIPYLIVGGGISGLSAARQLTKKGISDFLLLELEDHVGGNSSSGENQYSKYPLGAHYLPLPNREDAELLRFLEEEKIITGYQDGFLVFDEQQLTFSPHERLFYKNSWQEGLEPKFGHSVAENDAFKRFFAQMDFYQKGRGPDGKYWFDIPLDQSSSDADIRRFDRWTMKQWLDQNQFTVQPLLDYVDYCCRDDFGLGIDYISAWAGIHYFAGRKHNSAAHANDNVLTWPEGNARLASHLKKYTHGKTLQNHLVYEVRSDNRKAIVKAFDDVRKQSVEILADKVILATPQFVNQYLLQNRKTIARQFHYAPWLLATLTVSDLPDNYSYPLCWDNVIYGAKGLGYIYDQHQSLAQLQPRKVITYYASFSTGDIPKSRRNLYLKKADYWKRFVFDDLRRAHPDIEKLTESIELHLLGHGMISAVPGFLFGQARQLAAQPIDGCIYFAHSDLSGISIFEEAFHQGIAVVNHILHDTTLDS